MKSNYFILPENDYIMDNFIDQLVKLNPVLLAVDEEANCISTVGTDFRF